MTGFGDASAEEQGIHFAVEIRSLNNRYFKAGIRLPEEIAALEPELDSLLRKRFSRGSVTLNVGLHFTSDDAAYEVNEAALRKYFQQVKHVDASVELGSLMALPGVIQPPRTTQLVEKCRPILKRLVDQACAKLQAMRETEGRGLADDLIRHKAFIAERVVVIADRAPVVVEEYQKRLETRMESMLRQAKLEVDKVDLLKEVAVFAERCDISEEAQRITAHLDQFEQIITRGDGEPAGRTLDFLAQELLREANTIASKSNDAQISRVSVEIKGAIDRIKEQVQNVE